MPAPEEAVPISDLGEWAPVGLLSTNADGLVRQTNRTLLAWINRGAEEVVGRTRFSDLLTTAGRVYFETHLAPMLHLEGGFREVALTLEGGGLSRSVLVTANRIANITHFVLFEAEQRRGYERELDALRAAAETRSVWLRQVESLAEVGAWAIDLDTAVTTWSDRVFMIHDLPIGSPPSLDEAISFYRDEDRGRIRRNLEQTLQTGLPFSFDADLLTAKGRWRRVRATGELEQWGGRPKRVVGVIQDVTEQHKVGLELWRSAHIDSLSGVANRTLFQKRLRERIEEEASTTREGAGLALLLLDLDSFKEVNDTLGHAAGDEVIRCIAARLEGLSPTVDCARLGGDEFALLMSTRSGASAVNALAASVLDEVRREIPIHGERIYVSGSVGTARYPADANTPEDLLRCADIALYTSKRSGRSRISAYSREIGSIFDTRRTAIDMIRQARLEGNLLPVYQPCVCLAQGRVIGCEALVRLRGQDGRLVEPAEFWPAMSDPESTRQVDMQMLRLVTEQMAAWRSAGYDPGVVSLNVSEFSFHDDEYVQAVIDVLTRHSLLPASLRIEVTETVFLSDSTKPVDAVIEKLVRAGVSIALDDFGTGHASLIHLRDYPIDWIKIDKSFVRDLPSAARSEAIVVAMINLAHALGIKVVGEGIETEAQRDFLRAAGCDVGQGYYFASGLIAEEIHRQSL